MAADYGKRFQFSFKDEKMTAPANTWRVELHQLGYIYDVEPDLIGADDPLRIIGQSDSTNPQNPNWLISVRSIAISINDDAGRLSALGGIEEQEMKAIVYLNDVEFFNGWVKPGQYGHDRYLQAPITIQAVRGESNLKNKGYTTSAGALYDGLASPLEIIQNIKTIAGGPGGIVGTAMYWQPRLTNNLLSSHDTLKRLRVDQGELRDADKDAITAWSALGIVLRQYMLRLIEDAGNWIVLQRRKPYNAGANTFDVTLHNGDWQGTITSPYYLDVWGSSNVVNQGFQLFRTRPYKYASAIYNHLTPDAGVITDPGFEELDLGTVSSTETNVWVPTLGTIEISAPGNNSSGGTGTKSVKLPAVYKSGGASIPADFTSVSLVRQTTEGVIVGGADVSLIINAAFNIELNGTIPGQIYFCLRFKVGTYWLYFDSADADQPYKWSETPASNSEYLIFTPGFPFSGWQVPNIPTAPLIDGSTPITGVVYYEVRAPIEDTNGVGQATTFGRWDDLDFDVLNANGDQENEAEQRTAVYTSSKNVYAPPVETLLWGTLPTAGHKRREQIYDGADALVDIDGDWQFGDDHTGDASGLSHLGLYVTEWIRQHQYPLQFGSLSLYFPESIVGGVWSPLMVFRDTKRLKLAQDANAGSVAIRITEDTSVDKKLYGVLQPKRPLVIDGNEYIVSHVIQVEGRTWDVYLESTLSASYSAGEAVYQYTDFDWTRYEYSCKFMTLAANIIELFFGDAPDVTCNYNVKPGSLKAQKIQDIVGQPCFEVINTEDEVEGLLYLFVESGNAGGTGILAESLLQDDTVAVREPSGNVYTLINLPGATLDATIDFTLDKIIVLLDNNDVWIYDRLTGGNAAKIVDGGFSGYGNIVGITHIETGANAGKLFFNVEDATEPADNHLIRLNYDGTGETDLGALDVESGPIIGRDSDQSIIGINTADGAKLVRWDAAGSATYVSINSNVITSGKGVAHDVEKNRIFFLEGNTANISAGTDGGSAAYIEGDAIGSSEIIYYDKGRRALWVGAIGLKYLDEDGENETIISPFTGTYGAFTLRKVISAPFDPPPPGLVAPTKLFLVNDALQIKVATIDPDSTPWANTLLRAIPSNSLIDICVDLEEDVIFTIEANTGDKNRYLRKSNAQGGASSVIHTWTPADSSFAPGPRMDIDKVNKRLIVTMTDANINDRLEVLDYDGNVIQSASAVRDATTVGGIGVDETGAYAMWLSKSGSSQYVYRYDVATNSPSEIATVSTLVTETAGFSVKVDNGSKLMFFEDTVDNEIKTYPAPDGGSWATIETGTGSTDTGMDIDRVNKHVYHGKGTYKVNRINYDGTGETTVIDNTLETNNIQHVVLA